jgi:hypothetical protein
VAIRVGGRLRAVNIHLSPIADWSSIRATVPRTTMTPTVAPPIVPHIRDGRVPWWLALAGLAVATAGWMGWSPLVLLARAASDDGQLSHEFARGVLQSQFHFGWVLMAAAMAAPWLAAAGLRILDASTPASVRTRLLAIAALAGLFTWVIQQNLFGGIPHVTDAISHSFQAKILAGGQLWAARPDCHEFFRQINIYMTHSGRWFAPYPPGHALTLLPFTALGWPALFGPCAMAGTTYLLALCVQRYYGDRLASLVGLLFALSPLALLLGSSYMSHVSFLFYALLTVWAAGCGLDLRRSSTAARGSLVVAGLGAGMCFITRPQDAALLALSALLPLALHLRSHGPRYLSALPWAALGALAPLAWQGVWNHAIYGSALAVGYGRTALDVLHPVLLSRLGLSETFPLSKALQQFVWSCWRYDRALLGCGGATLLAALALVVRPPDRRDLVCAWSVAVVLLFYCFCDYYGFEFEARYFSPAIPGTLVLLARGLQRVSGWLRRPVTAALLAALVVHGLSHYWPRYVWPTYGGAYEEVTPALHQAARAAGLDHAVVLVPSEGDFQFRYSSGFVWNDPALQAPILYAREPGGDLGCLFRSFPDRRVFRFVPEATPYQGRFEEVPRPARDQRTERTTPAA